jgi:DNA polymerase III delta prime subunit
MNLYNQLWVEAYRPKHLEDIILSEENRKFFSSINEDTPHILLHGKAGTGKTTLAKIIVKDILKCQYLYINASDENGVDTIRNKVISFAQTSSLDGKKKIILLDEFDGMADSAQRILRSVMEEYSDTTRFILTANYISRIIEPIQSRCLMFKNEPSVEDCIKRCVFILKNENIQVPDDQKSLLVDFITKKYPDLRRIINDLQRFSTTGKLFISTKNETKNLAERIYNLLLAKTSSLEVRKIVIQEEVSFGSDYQNLMKEILNLFYESKLKEDNKKRAMLEIGEHIYRDNSVLDHEINFFCCLMALESAIF